MGGVDGTEAVVVEARGGDRLAREKLVARYLPLVYDVVGRALNGHPDVDDVVQETMLRALSGLRALRDPARFRSWLLAIAMNQVRSRWAALGHRPAPLADTDEPADRAADFVDLTILRLELSGQRRETAEATRWLDDSQRDVLAVWWLEAAGRLSRAELADALGMTPQHAAVRVQRVKNQLDTARAVVRALAAEPRCPELDALLADWDGTPTPLWRKRVARHLTGCAGCSAGSAGLLPAEGLLSGLALVVPWYDGGQRAAEALAQAAAHTTSSSAAAPAALSAAKAGGLITAGAAATAALAVFLWPAAPPAPPQARTPPASALPAPPPTRGAEAPPAPATSPAPEPSAPRPSTPAPSAEPTAPSLPRTVAAPPATTAPAPSPSPATTTPAPAPRTLTGPAPAPLLVDEVNTLRAECGCPGLRTDPRLTEIAQRQAEEMAARGYVTNTDAAGRDTGERVRAAGYLWSAVGETLAHGQDDPAEVAAMWRDSAEGGTTVQECGFVHVGVGVADSPSGPYWTQVLATPQ
ncbi:sigma-70 family RNA polymerase sigma factor [Streptomyces sp. NPDC046887]|uniref:sigma-70 family RNA polymerase sigma factor n=1 Tax=Streptomyces sp. NPDC046887 TaxID=3155472 RepID=UPI0033D3DC20